MKFKNLDPRAIGQWATHDIYLMDLRQGQNKHVVDLGRTRW